MPEYIEREALIAAYDTAHKGPPGRARKLMVDAPAADVAQVVRCKDCKHYHSETGYCYINSYFVDGDGMSCSPAESPSWTMFEPDDFCSYGERKDGE